MNRKTRIRLVVSTVVVTSGLALLVIYNRPPPKVMQTASTAATPSSAADTSSFTLENFHRFQTREGKKVWDLTAVRGKYGGSNQNMDLEEPYLEVAQEQGPPATLRSKTAKVVIDKGEIGAAHAFGDVVIVSDQVTINSQEALYDPTHNRLEVPSRVKVIKAELTVESDRLIADTKKQIFEFYDNVETTLLPR